MARTMLTLVRITPAVGTSDERPPFRVAGLITTSSGNRVVALSTRRNPTRPQYTGPTGKDAA